MINFQHNSFFSRKLRLRKKVLSQNIESVKPVIKSVLMDVYVALITNLQIVNDKTEETIEMHQNTNFLSLSYLFLHVY